MIDSSYLTHGYRSTRARGWLKEGLLVLGVSLLISLSGLLSIPLPFTPVPLVIQSHVILFFAALLGRQKAVAAVSLFLLEGALGLPVFAGGKGGLLCFVGPTAGYLVGYLVAAFVTGYLVDRAKEKTGLSVFKAMGIGSLFMLFLGASWLALFVGFIPALLLGIVPFLLGDFCKLLVATRLLIRLQK